MLGFFHLMKPTTFLLLLACAANGLAATKVSIIGVPNGGVASDAEIDGMGTIISSTPAATRTGTLPSSKREASSSSSTERDRAMRIVGVWLDTRRQQKAAVEPRLALATFDERSVNLRRDFLFKVVRLGLAIRESVDVRLFCPQRHRRLHSGVRAR